MNAVLFGLQVLLALHTVMGAVWKLSNSEQAVPSLASMPHGLWMALMAIELLLAVGLVLPVWVRRWGGLVPLAAAGVAAEMLLFTALHLRSGVAEHGQMVYWLVVAAVCLFLAAGRAVWRPLASSVAV